MLLIRENMVIHCNLISASRGCEVGVTARVPKIGKKIWKFGELVLERELSVKMKGRMYRSCVRNGMLYGSETWCLPENELLFLEGLKQPG